MEKTSDTKIPEEPKMRKGTNTGHEKQDLLNQTKQIFEEVKNVKIDLQFSSGYVSNGSADIYDNYNGMPTIQLSKKKEETLKTSLERGLAYVAFDTSKNAYSRQHKEFSDLMGINEENHKQPIQDMIYSAYSALEQRRVNSCMGHVFKGFDERHKESDARKAEELFNSEDFEGINDPVTALQCSMLGMTEEVEKSDFKEVNKLMTDVERTSPDGSLILTAEFVENIFKPWYEAQMANQQQGGNKGQGKGNNPDPDGTPQSESDLIKEAEAEAEEQAKKLEELKEEIKDEFDPEHKGETNWKGKEPTDRQKEYLEKIINDNGNISPETKDAMIDAPETRGGMSDLISKMLNGDSGDYENDKPEPSRKDPINGKLSDEDKKLRDAQQQSERNRQKTNVAEQMQGKNDGSYLEPVGSKGSIKDAQEKGEEMIEELEERIAEAGQGDNTEDKNNRKIIWRKEELDKNTSRCKEYKNLPNTGSPNVDMQTVRKLKGIFKNIKSKPIEEISDSGQNIDVELFIKDEIEGGTDFFTEEVEQQGFAVVIGIDESGSMGGEPIQIAKNVCGTLYKAFENMPNVEIHVIGWQSNYSSCDVHIIKKFQEVGSLHTGGGTPFRQSMLYLGEYVKKLPQKKKLLFQITDGGIDYDEKTKNYLQKMRNDNDTVVTGIQISYYEGGDPAMHDLFGKENCLTFQDMKQVKNLLVKDITQRFVRYMKC